MKLSWLLVLFFLTQFTASGQTRRITGKVIYADDFSPLYGANVHIDETTVVSDTAGAFVAVIPTKVKFLVIRFVGMEPQKIQIDISCKKIELILQSAITYDFISMKKETQLRKREFNKLPSLYTQAFEKKIFESEQPCYTWISEP